MPLTIEELPERLERLCADMVLNPFGIVFGSLPPDPEGEQEIAHEAVTLSGVGCESTTFLCQEDGAVRLTRHKIVANEALHGAGDSCGTDPEPHGQVGCARFPASNDQIIDHLDVILGEL